MLSTTNGPGISLRIDAGLKQILEWLYNAAGIPRKTPITLENYGSFENALSALPVHNPLHPFLEGYILKRLASNTAHESDRSGYIHKAIGAFETFLERYPTGMPAYYAQWQIGILQKATGQSWPFVEEVLSKAASLVKDRGEAMQAIIKHYRQQEEFGLSYIYSQIAVHQYAGHLPASLDWEVDLAFYQWKALNYHMSNCARLGIVGEAKQTHEKLWEVYNTHEDYFSEEQVQQLFRNVKLYSNE